MWAGAHFDGREVVEEEDAWQLVAGGHVALLEVLRHRVLVGEDGAVADVLVDRGHDLRAAAAGVAEVLLANMFWPFVLCSMWTICVASERRARKSCRSPDHLPYLRALIL